MDFTYPYLILPVLTLLISSVPNLHRPHQFADFVAVPRRLSQAGMPSTSGNDAGTTSTVAPVGPNKEVEYFFASDARYDNSHSKKQLVIWSEQYVL